MADMKFTLPASETVTLAGQTIDKLIQAGDGDAALLYLYILKTRGLSTSAQAAVAMGKHQGLIASAMAVLASLGLVEIEKGADNQPAVPQTGEPTSIPKAASPQAGYPTEPPEPLEEPRKYTIEELKTELQSPDSDFVSVVEETQNSLGRQLTPDELMRLLGIYDALRLPPEVILQLITHCISESRLSGGRAPSLRYIEKAAYTWEREGINSLERAEEYIKALEARRSLYGRIKITLQIKDREFSPTEKRYVDGWIDMGFEPESIAIAYDKTLVKTGKMAWSYMDTILKSWHGKGIHTLREVQEKDRWPARNSPGAAYGKDATFNAPNQSDLERMQRLLEKIKEE